MAGDDDPRDINQGQNYVFLKGNATECMRKNKRRVRYVFIDEIQVEMQQLAQEN